MTLFPNQIIELGKFFLLFSNASGHFLIIYFLFYLRNKTFLSTSIKPVILPIKSLIISDDISRICRVKTGMIIEDFPVFEIYNNNFIVNCVVWFEFDRSKVSLDAIDRFSFLNVRDIKKELTEKFVIDNDMFIQYKVQINFSVDLDHRLFPMNDYSIFLVMTNDYITAEEIVFDVEDAAITTTNDLKIENWNIASATAEAGYNFSLLRESSETHRNYPRVLFALNIKKVSLRKLTLIIMPILIILFISTTSMFSFPRSPRNLALVVGSLTGILAYRYIIQRVSPDVGYYTLSEHIFNFCLALIFLTFILVLYREIHPTGIFSEEFGHLWFYGTKPLTVAFIAYLLFFWKKKNVQSKNIVTQAPNKTLISKSSLFKHDDLNKLTLTDFYKNHTCSQSNHVFKNYIYNNFFHFEFLQPTISWTLVLRMMRTYKNNRLIHGNNLTLTLSVKPPSKCILFSRLTAHNNFSLKHLEQLKKLGIINDSLEIISKNDFIIFNQNNIQCMNDIMDILPIQLVLMLKNPSQCFLMQNVDNIKKWENDINLSQNNYYYKKFNNEFIELIESFLDLLPKAIYLENHVKNEVDLIKITSLYINSDRLPDNTIKSIIYDLDKIKYFNVKSGLFYSAPHKGIMTWHMSADEEDRAGFAILQFNSPRNTGRLDWHSTANLASESANNYKVDSYDLLYGFKIDPLKKIIHFKKELILGSTMDLSRTASNISNSLCQGIYTKFIAQNKEGGIHQQPLKMFVMDDEYNPVLAKKNATFLMTSFLKQPILISPVGTPTVESYANLIRDKKLMVLFPISGGSILRSEQFQNIVFFRSSFTLEGRMLLNYAIEIKSSKRVAIFYQDDSYGIGALNGIQSILDETKIDHLLIPYQRNNPNVEHSVDEIKKFNPDSLLFFSTAAPSIALVHALEIERLADMSLLAIAYAANGLLEALASMGIPLIHTHLVPKLNSELAIVSEYRQALQLGLLLGNASDMSLEGYIIASLVCEIFDSIKPPYHMEAILEKIVSIKNYNFKGLPLNFNPQTRELYNEIWLDTGSLSRFEIN